MLGLAIPLIVAGPLCEFSSMAKLAKVLMSTLVSDYTVQGARFQVIAGFGCGNASDRSVLTLLLLNSWSVVLPLISITIYYRKSTTHIGMI